jgi:hypothetical protein
MNFVEGLRPGVFKKTFRRWVVAFVSAFQFWLSFYRKMSGIVGDVVSTDKKAIKRKTD